jgi:hypothetical protein
MTPLEKTHNVYVRVCQAVSVIFPKAKVDLVLDDLYVNVDNWLSIYVEDGSFALYEGRTIYGGYHEPDDYEEVHIISKACPWTMARLVVEHMVHVQVDNAQEAQSMYEDYLEDQLIHGS